MGRRQQPGVTSDYVAKAFDYQSDVLAGKIPVCKRVRQAVERNRANLKGQRSKAFPYAFDEAAAHAICLAGEQFPHIKGPKAIKVCPVHGERKCLKCDPTEFVWQRITLEPWQCWVYSTLFGWKRLEDDLRRFRTGLVLVPRKNAKSTMAAIVGNYMLACDGESGAEVYSAATKHDQSKIIFDAGREMAKRTPTFQEFFGVHVGKHALSVAATASSFVAVGADADTLDGLNVHCALIDEIHAHKTRHVWDVFETATGTRLQPLMLGVSTAGVNTAGILSELLNYLEKILDGVIHDETFFGINYTIDPDDDWRLPQTHRKANPNYGVSVQPDDLMRKVKKAEHSPAAINNFLTKHLNVWTKAETTWIPAEAWRACAVPGLTLEDCLGDPCWIIVDLNEVRDIAAVMALFQRDGGKYAAFAKYFLPAKTVQTSPNALYPGWVHKGLLIETPGDVADYQRIEDEIVKLVELCLPKEVDFDRALASRMMQNLQARLGEDTPVVIVPQNVQTIDPAMNQVEELVFGKKLQHDGDEILAWMMSNVVVIRNHKGEIYPRKAGGKDSHNKIDGVMTLLMGLSRAMAPDDDDDDQTTYYDDRGVLVVR
jgi:phage terminase large subunit-like protein